MRFEQWFYTLPLRLRSLLRGTQVDRELKEEIHDHIEQQIKANIARGMPEQEARRSALNSIGAIAQIEDQCRDERRVNNVENFFQDLRYGLRQLLRSPGFSALTILCLTLGIGANAAVFSWIEGILFRPYPAVTHQERLLALSGTAVTESGQTELSWPDFVDLQRNCTLADVFIVSKITGASLGIGDRSERVRGSIVTANYFDALGIHPILGRGFRPEEELGRNDHPVIVISYQLWKTRFKGDPEIIGKTQLLSGVQHTIIGVAPEGFYGTFVGWAIQFWAPTSMEELFEGGGYKLDDRGARWIEGYMRLKPGVSRQQAQEETSAVMRRLEADYPSTNRGRGVRLWPLWQTPWNNAGNLLPTLGIMFAVVIFVLLIACANVGNLLVVRSFARRHEMTVRLALGCGSGRLLKQLLTEGLLLSSLGAAGGMLVAYWTRHALVLLFPVRAGMVMYLPGELDWRVLASSVGVCLMTTVLIGLIPAIQTRKLNLAGVLNAESGGVVGGRGRARFRSILVLVQVSLSFILLVGAGLLLQSLQNLRTESPGFSTKGVVNTSVDLVSAGYDAQRAYAFRDQLMDRVNALPGVESAAFALFTPLGFGTYPSGPIDVEGYQLPPEEQPTVDYNEVGPAYFSTVGIALVAGREFVRSDDLASVPVAIVNETMATRFWGGIDAIGKRFQVKGRWMQVVGVASDSKYESVREIPKPFFYLAMRQTVLVRGSNLNIRTRLSPETMATALAREVRAIDSNLALYETITLQEQLDRSTSSQKVAVTLVGILGGLALLLAAIGLYGVMSYVVSQSSRELGLRMALGADSSTLLRLVLRRGLTLTAIGMLLGTLGALELTRLISGFLYKVSPRDPVAFGSGVIIMAIVSVAACAFPAWRAAQTDPVRALRN
ncbi:MAG TPA: ABC transporter permease [Blastocatellia bacterium]|nr:ABC transporter permease [Blastocatellia bacterium]